MVTDQPPLSPQVCAGKTRRHVGAAPPSPSLPTVEAPASAPSLPTVAAHVGRVSQCAQQIQGAAQTLAPHTVVGQ